MADGLDIDLLSDTLSDVYVRQELLNSLLASRWVDELRKEPLDNDSLDFREVTLKSIDILKEFFDRFPSRSCDYSLGGILMWSDYYDYKMAIHNSTLFIKGYDRDNDVILYYEPLGLMSRDEAWKLIKNDMNSEGKPGVIVSPYQSESEILGDDTANKGEFRRDLMEYLYDIEKFLHFGGKKMEKKRNHLNYFIKHYPGFSVDVIGSENIAELIAFTHEYEKNHEDSALFNYESSQTIRVLENYDKYPFVGILIRYEGKVIGYSFGEKIGDTFFAHVEKGDINFNGVYQALASYMSQEVNNRYPDVRYLNREEDMGNESLRKSKESYHPTLFMHKSIEHI